MLVKELPRETIIEPIQITFTDMIIVPHLKVILSFIVQLVPIIWYSGHSVINQTLLS